MCRKYEKNRLTKSTYVCNDGFLITKVCVNSLNPNAPLIEFKSGYTEEFRRSHYLYYNKFWHNINENIFKALNNKGGDIREVLSKLIETLNIEKFKDVVISRCSDEEVENYLIRIHWNIFNNSDPILLSLKGIKNISRKISKIIDNE